VPQNIDFIGKICYNSDIGMKILSNFFMARLAFLQAGRAFFII
jgi:hypothetical protein